MKISVKPLLISYIIIIIAMVITLFSIGDTYSIYMLRTEPGNDTITAEVEPEGIFVAAVGIEVGAGHIGHARVHRLGQQGQGVQTLFQGGEDEQAALRLCHPGECLNLPDAGQHRFQLDAVAAADFRDVRGQKALFDVFGADRLVKQGRMKV